MSDDTDDEYTLDDEFEYAGWRIGRPTRTAEVDAPDGTHTIEEGVLTCELVTKDQLREAKLDGEWTAHFVAPDGGIGFGLDEGNSGGVAVPYALEATITFPTPMTEKEADEWLPDGWFRDYPDTDVPGLERFDDSDSEDDDTGGVVVDSPDGDEPIMTSDTTAADILEDLR
ncbi:hypothetical protein [Halorubrum sp. CSM-61]|uniref:hypothetical protein n=1 Tax=Halorubrum sp. CSM-61 TaxID=2485838 RepID=UPI000F4CB245|nr:hypothetical protein [Halorubrum sp. CSM-61]